MIAAEARLEVAWLPIDRIVYGNAQKLDIGKVEFYAKLMDYPEESHIAPIMVSPHGDTNSYYIRDGKHRFVAHLVLGRHRVRALIVTDPE